MIKGTAYRAFGAGSRYKRIFTPSALRALTDWRQFGTDAVVEVAVGFAARRDDDVTRKDVEDAMYRIHGEVYAETRRETEGKSDASRLNR